VATQLVRLPRGAARVVITAIMDDGDVVTWGHALNLCLVRSTNGSRPAHGASMVWQSGYYESRDGSRGNSAPGLGASVDHRTIAVGAQLITRQPVNIGLSLAVFDAAGSALPIDSQSGVGRNVQVPVYPKVLR
jgi:hypothetical protein